MNMRVCPIVLPALLALAACVPGAAEYSKTEAPNRLRVDAAESRVELAFAPGSARLSAAEVGRLDRLVASGAIRPADRVAVAAAGGPEIAARRAAAISSALLRYGIVTDTRILAGVPPNRAVVAIGRYAVTLPPCPNWSQPADYDFTNSQPSWYGCADATNLGLTAASPGDLVAGRPLAQADGTVAASAVNRYLNDRVKNPPSPTASPFAPAPGGDQGAGGPPPAAGAGPQ
ncbi:MAG TPA: CpaD family pilus assembly lipoprotein [Stellaceae bacterium]|jgi:pilus assembly protein CpaD